MRSPKALEILWRRYCCAPSLEIMDELMAELEKSLDGCDQSLKNHLGDCGLALSELPRGYEDAENSLKDREFEPARTALEFFKQKQWLSSGGADETRKFNIEHVLECLNKLASGFDEGGLRRRTRSSARDNKRNASDERKVRSMMSAPHIRGGSRISWGGGRQI